MKIKFYTLCVILIFNSFKTRSQNNDLEGATYNIAFGAVFSTIGAIINKEKKTPIKKIIRKSLWQGALGGYITFESKRLLREASRREKWGYFWAAKILNSAGTSIKENSASNIKFGERWILYWGFNRIEFNTREKFSVNYKLMPVALAYSINAFTKYNFEINHSLKTGQFIFSTNKELPNGNFEVVASAFPGLIVFEKNIISNFHITSHEILHLFQSNEFSILNSYTNKLFKKWSMTNRFTKNLNKYTYIDSHYIALRALYLLEGNNAKNYTDNFFEHEAEYYTR